MRKGNFTLNVNGTDVEYKYIGFGGDKNGDIDIMRYVIYYPNRVGGNNNNVLFINTNDTDEMIRQRTYEHISMLQGEND